MKKRRARIHPRHKNPEVPTVCPHCGDDIDESHGVDPNTGRIVCSFEEALGIEGFEIYIVGALSA